MENNTNNLDKKRVNPLWFLVPVFIALIIGAFALGTYWASTRLGEVPQSDTKEPLITSTVNGNDNPIVDDANNNVKEIDKNENNINTNVSNTFSIDWATIQNQTKQDVNPILLNAFYSESKQYAGEGDYKVYPVSYKLGVVSGGKYDGYILSNEALPLDGMGIYYQYLYLLTDPNNVEQPIVIDRYGISIQGVFTKSSEYKTAREMLSKGVLEKLDGKITFNASIVIPELEYENSVYDTQGRKYFFSGVWHKLDYPNKYNLEDYSVVATLEDGKELRMVDMGEDIKPRGFQSSFLTTSKDNHILVYDLVVPFLQSGNDMSSAVSIAWKQKTLGGSEYFKGLIGGCGTSAGLNVVQLDNPSSLLPAGTFVQDGIKKSVYIDDYYSSEYDDSYKTWQQLNENGTRDDFVVSIPYFFWQDSFGRWIKFTNMELIPAVECGKPVIYLYPEETTAIDVNIDLAIGFTKTVPEYKNGWRVIAEPDGTLTNRDDGKVYPYIFWEGRGGMYTEPEYYWVVEQTKVEDFLIAKLNEIGLNSQESADFIEFWLPRMQSAAWYKIGFHGTQFMDGLAPMSLSVKPDSVLRVLMDYTELDAPITANPLSNIPTFERNGFTVVEWGGVLK